MFNLEHVNLVSLLDTPIESFVSNGIRTADGSVHELDVVVLATGFDAVDGNYLKMDIRGSEGMTIQEAWSDGPKSYLGITTHGFPNMFMILGPQSPFCNLPPAIETQVRWVASAISHAVETKMPKIEVDQVVQRNWLDHCNEIADHSLFAKTQSWIFGANIPGKPQRVVFYMDGLRNYSEILQDEKQMAFPSYAQASGQLARASEGQLTK